jgi:hypothetical protein
VRHRPRLRHLPGRTRRENNHRRSLSASRGYRCRRYLQFIRRVQMKRANPHPRRFRAKLSPHLTAVHRGPPTLSSATPNSTSCRCVHSVAGTNQPRQPPAHAPPGPLGGPARREPSAHPRDGGWSASPRGGFEHQGICPTATVRPQAGTGCLTVRVTRFHWIEAKKAHEPGQPIIAVCGGGLRRSRLTVGGRDLHVTMWTNDCADLNYRGGVDGRFGGPASMC